jgi:hypothetical protein
MQYVLISYVILSISGSHVEVGKPSIVTGVFDTKAQCEAFRSERVKEGFPKEKLECVDFVDIRMISNGSVRLTNQ